MKISKITIKSLFGIKEWSGDGKNIELPSAYTAQGNSCAGGGTTNSTVNSLDLASMQKPSRGGQTTSIENLGDWESIPVRVKILFGAMTMGNIPNGERSKYSCENIWKTGRNSE